MAALHVYLFRDFYLEKDDAPLAALENRKAKELFSYLLLNNERPHRREALMTLLWEEGEADKSRRNMRQALWQLQRQLDSNDLDQAQRILMIDGDWIQINQDAELWCDVLIFQLAYHKVQGIEGYEMDDDSAQRLREAIALYRGGLLENWYEEWCLIERENLQNAYLMMLDKMMDYCGIHLHWEEGITYGTRSLKLDRARERTYRRMMRLHALRGDRTGAIRLYEQCAAALRQELTVEPSQRTRELFERIRNDEPLLYRPGLDRVQHFANAPLVAIDLARLLFHVTQLTEDLDNARTRLTRDVEIVTRHITGD